MVCARGKVQRVSAAARATQVEGAQLPRLWRILVARETEAGRQRKRRVAIPV